MPSGATRLVFLAGDPVAHTRGYAEYAAALADAGVDAAYLPAHVPAGQLFAFLQGLAAARNVAGVVATVPHKQDAFALCRPDEKARRSGAANVLRPSGDGWEGTELDGAGFLAAATAAGIDVEGRRVQIIGAGGAGRSVAMAVVEQGPVGICVHDAIPARATALADTLQANFPAVAAVASLEQSDILINCSTVGMRTEDGLPCPEEFIPRGGAVYEVVNRADTALLVAAAGRGCRTDYGRSMMRAQVPLVLDYLFRR